MKPSRLVAARRSRRSLSRRHCIAVVALVLAFGCAAPASPGLASAASSPVVLMAPNGTTSAELLHRLTVPQLAAVLHTTPAQLAVQIEALEGLSGGVGVELGGALVTPSTTLQDLLDLLAARGVSTAPLEQLINRLLAGVTDSAEQLRMTIDEVLADLREDGQIEALAHELVLPAAVVETMHLLPSSVEQLARSVNTTIDHLAALLFGAGASSQPGESSQPFVASTVPSTAAGGTSVIVGMPTGNGGLSLTVVNPSTSGPAAASAAASSISNGFTIVSVKVTRGGVILETVKLPGPGQLAINASTRRKVAVRSRNGHTRTAVRTATLASVRSGLPGGIHTLALRLRGAASRNRPLVVRLVTTYTPTGGSSRTIARTVTIRRAPKRRHR